MIEQNKLNVVSICLGDEPPLYSRKNMQNPSEVIEVLQEELNKYDRELFCILNLKTKGQVINLNIVSMGDYYGAAGSSAIIRFSLASYSAVLLPATLCYIFRT